MRTTSKNTTWSSFSSSSSNLKLSKYEGDEDENGMENAANTLFTSSLAPQHNEHSNNGLDIKLATVKALSKSFVFVTVENPRTREKSAQSLKKQQTQSTLTSTMESNPATLVKDECSHHMM